MSWLKCRPVGKGNENDFAPEGCFVFQSISCCLKTEAPVRLLVHIILMGGRILPPMVRGEKPHPGIRPDK